LAARETAGVRKERIIKAIMATLREVDVFLNEKKFPLERAS
jgi:hypothetical protein